MNKVGIGIIGCGNISDAYLKAIVGFPLLEVRGVADIRPEAALAAAAKHELKAQTMDALLCDDDISRLIEMAERQQLRVGCAPDTFLGGGHQTCRTLIDGGALGSVVAGTAFFMCPGHERWHPNPAFYYQPGGGPMLDMGPYYITALVNLIGPVARVSGITSRSRTQRLITSEPLKGQLMDVTVASYDYNVDVTRRVADMAHALRSGRAHRASGELALHALEVMEAFQVSSDSGRHVQIASRPPRPAPLPASLMPGLLD